LLGGAGDDALYGQEGQDLLRGRAGDDLLVGGRGDDTLRGGRGNDVYVHGLHDGHDVIWERGSGIDTLLLGAGIRPQSVRLDRQGSDLVVDVQVAAGGKVTVKGWFESPEKRIERIEFANGAVWNVAQIRDRVRYGDSQDAGPAQRHEPKDEPRDRPDRNSDVPSARDTEARRHDNDPVGDLIAKRLARAPRLDFEALATLGSGVSENRSVRPSEIEQAWAKVRSYTATLSLSERESETESSSGSLWQAFSADQHRQAASWGYEGSTGAYGEREFLKPLSGLTEGFAKL
jgi:hypothetical protein